MNKHPDWLEETWGIKKNIARQYAGVPMSQQLREMHLSVMEEFRRRGWNYPESAIPVRAGRANAGKP